ETSFCVVMSGSCPWLPLPSVVGSFTRTLVGGGGPAAGRTGEVDAAAEADRPEDVCCRLRVRSLIPARALPESIRSIGDRLIFRRNSSRVMGEAWPAAGRATTTETARATTARIDARSRPGVLTRGSGSGPLR